MDIPIYVKVYVCVRNRKEGDRYLSNKIRVNKMRRERSGGTHTHHCLYVLYDRNYLWYSDHIEVYFFTYFYCWRLRTPGTGVLSPERRH